MLDLKPSRSESIEAVADERLDTGSCRSTARRSGSCDHPGQDVGINDDPALEAEADRAGERVMSGEQMKKGKEEKSRGGRSEKESKGAGRFQQYKHARDVVGAR